MKKWITAVLLMLALMMSISLPVSARDIEYFEEDGVQYCWVRSGSTEKPTRKVEGHAWVAVYVDGKRDTRLGVCEDAGKANHVCDIFCDFERLEYKWKLVVKEIMLVKSLNQDNYTMVGSEFIMLKQKIKTNADGSYLLDAQGKLQYEASEIIGKGQVEIDGYARLRLDESKLEPDAEFQQLVLGQNLAENQMDTYSPLQNRWYVNLVLNNEGEYEVYSVTEAPAANITDPEELKNSNFGVKGEESVSEYNARDQILTTRNDYRVGDLIVEIAVNGFDGQVPYQVKTNITISGPNDYIKRIRKSDTLSDVRMGEYTIECSNPVVIEGYIAEKPVVTVKCPVEADPVELTDDVKTVLLSRDHANAVINITYTYTPLHIHDFEAVVTYPTCIDEGYTTYTCKDETCGYTYRDDEVEPYGHDYKAETKEPTCTEDGHTTYTCINCGQTYQETGELATGHDYKEMIKKATCTENGYTVYKCSKCGNEYKEDGEEAAGHKYAKAVTKPTCTEKGYTTYTCSVCNYSYRGDEVAATGHSYTSKVIEPTMEREGYTLYTCSVCKDTYTGNHEDKLSDEEDSDDNGSDNNSSNTASNNSGATTGTQNTVSSSGSSIDTLVAKSIDDLDQPLNGTVVALYSGNTPVRTWNSTYDNVFVLDNLEKYAKEGESMTYTLAQTKAPDGYEISEESFTVVISKQNGKTEVDVKKKEGASDSIETGKDGKQIVTFRNRRKTTRIELSCQVAVEFGENCLTDDALVTECQEKQYEFVLKWKDGFGEEQTESILLLNGETGLLEAELPFGTEYAITLVDPEGTLITEFSANAAGTLTKEQVKEKMAVEATLKYTIRADEPLLLSMIVVDSESGQPLEGATFELKDPDGFKVGTYTSSEGGELDIADVFTVPGDYLLTQTKAPEGYEMLSGAAPVIVSYTYAPDTETGAPGLVQSMSAQIAHQAASLESDGSYWIENMPTGVQVQQESKGLGLGAILGIVGGVVSLGGGAVAFVLIRRKRRQERV